MLLRLLRAEAEAATSCEQAIEIRGLDAMGVSRCAGGGRRWVRTTEHDWMSTDESSNVLRKECAHRLHDHAVCVRQVSEF